MFYSRPNNFVPGMFTGVAAGAVAGMIAIFFLDKKKRRKMKKIVSRTSSVLGQYMNKNMH